MKIDMSSKAVTNRLKTVDQLRKVCLSLANSNAGKKINFPAEKSPSESLIRWGRNQRIFL